MAFLSSAAEESWDTFRKSQRRPRNRAKDNTEVKTLTLHVAVVTIMAETSALPHVVPKHSSLGPKQW